MSTPSYVKMGVYLVVGLVLAGIALGFLAVRTQARGFLYQSANIDAKIICTAIFVTGRTREDALSNSEMIATMDTPFYLAADVDASVDRQNRYVEVDIAVPMMAMSVSSKTARYHGDQGCVLDADDGAIHFKPVSVASALAAANEITWPMGDLDSGPDAEHRRAIGIDKIESALDLVFSRPEEQTMAFLVVHRGRIIGERYAEGIMQDMPLESWSMGKSIAATLIGRLMLETGLSLDDRAPIPEWQDDPKHEITIRNLLNMSSGIEFRRDMSIGAAFRDHLYVYTAGIDTMSYINGKSLEHEPNSVGRYRNSDPLSLMYILKQSLEEPGENYLAWPQEQLFDKIGARHFMLEPDPYGLFLISGFDYGVARDWARLGMLYLQDGVWNGERILPEGFTNFVSTPAPAWDARPLSYGGLFWLNEFGVFEFLPKDTFFMAGSGEQFTWIVPSLDLVIVRQGHRLGQRQESLGGTLDNAHELIVDAVSGS